MLDINDQKESNEVVRFFESLAVEFNCPVILILHFNPGSEKGRGHFGSQLERKSESIIAVTKSEVTGISTIKGKLLRNCGSIPQLQFIYDTDKGHHIYYGTTTKTSKADEKNLQYQQLVEKIFEGGRKSYTYTELYNLIVEEEKVGERTAKGRIKNWVEAGIIVKSDGAEPKYSICSKSENTAE